MKMLSACTKKVREMRLSHNPGRYVFDRISTLCTFFRRKYDICAFKQIEKISILFIIFLNKIIKNLSQMREA